MIPLLYMSRYQLWSRCFWLFRYSDHQTISFRGVAYFVHCNISLFFSLLDLLCDSDCPCSFKLKTPYFSKIIPHILSLSYPLINLIIHTILDSHGTFGAIMITCLFAAVYLIICGPNRVLYQMGRRVVYRDLHVIPGLKLCLISLRYT